MFFVGRYIDFNYGVGEEGASVFRFGIVVIVVVIVRNLGRGFCSRGG